MELIRSDLLFSSGKITSNQRFIIQHIPYRMSNTGDNIRKSLLKRQEALERFKARKKSFLLFSEQTKRDIEEAREIWENTLEQLPKQEFN